MSARAAGAAARWGSVGTACLVLAADCRTELGVAVAMSHVAAVYLASFSRSRGWILGVALLCTVLTGVGWLLSPAGGEAGKILANRFLAAATISITAIVCWRWVGLVSREADRAAEAEAEHSRERDRAQAMAGLVEDLRVERERVRVEAEERRRAEAAVGRLERFRETLEAAPIAIIMMAREGEVHLVNREAEKMFGYPRDELVSQSVDRLFSETVREWYAALREAFFEDSDARPPGVGPDLVGRHRSGSEFALEVGFSRIDTDSGSFVLCSFTDVTERRRQEEEIRRYSEQLERANAELEEFAHASSHDLQEPVRKIISFAECLEMDAGEALPESALEDIQYITDGARQMGRLVTDLLAYSRTGHADLDLEDVPLGECVDDALDVLSLSLKESGAEIQRDTLPTVRGDRTLLTQLFQNLIGNAVKFSPEAPSIALTVENAKDGCILGVRDTGIGIDPRFADRIFGTFKRLHTREEYDGSGVGLAICRRVVQRHGGRIWVESEPGKGAHFKFTLGVAEGRGGSRSDAYEERAGRTP